MSVFKTSCLDEFIRAAQQSSAGEGSICILSGFFKDDTWLEKAFEEARIPSGTTVYVDRHVSQNSDLEQNYDRLKDVADQISDCTKTGFLIRGDYDSHMHAHSSYAVLNTVLGGGSTQCQDSGQYVSCEAGDLLLIPRTVRHRKDPECEEYSSDRLVMGVAFAPISL